MPSCWPARARALYHIAIYAFMGIVLGVTALLLTGRMNAAHPTVAIGMEFDAIAAVVLGGTSFERGDGRLFGTVVGVAAIADTAQCAGSARRRIVAAGRVDRRTDPGGHRDRQRTQIETRGLRLVSANTEASPGARRWTISNWGRLDPHSTALIYRIVLILAMAHRACRDRRRFRVDRQRAQCIAPGEPALPARVGTDAGDPVRRHRSVGRRQSDPVGVPRRRRDQIGVVTMARRRGGAGLQLEHRPGERPRDHAPAPAAVPGYLRDAVDRPRAGVPLHGRAGDLWFSAGLSRVGNGLSARRAGSGLPHGGGAARRYALHVATQCRT